MPSETKLNIWTDLISSHLPICHPDLVKICHALNVHSVALEDIELAPTVGTHAAHGAAASSSGDHSSSSSNNRKDDEQRGDGSDEGEDDSGVGGPLGAASPRSLPDAFDQYYWPILLGLLSQQRSSCQCQCQWKSILILS